MGRILSFPMVAILLGACAGSTAVGGTSARTEEGARVPDATDTSSPASPSWPEHLVTLDGLGPALFDGADPEAPAFGFVSKGVVLRVEGAPRGTRIPVKTEGAFEVRGHLELERLGARVQKRGRIAGTPVYVGSNDVVRVLGEAETGALRVEARPVYVGDRRIPLGAFIGTYPTAGLGGHPVPAERVELPTEGRPARLPPGRSVELYDRPNGSPVTTLPPHEDGLPIVMLVEEGEWKGIRVGTGPYLVGFVRETLMPSEPIPAAPDPLARGAMSGPLPVRLLAESDRPLFKVPAGTEVRFYERVIGVLHREGYAREMERFPESGELDGFLAVDEDVAVRALVPLDVLTPIRR